MRLHNKIKENLGGDLLELNQTDLGKVFGVSRISMNRWLRDKATPRDEETQNKIAKIVKRPKSEIFYYGE